MNSAERQQAIANVLIHRRQETVANLMSEFGVSRSTILRDIATLTCSLPIETVRGRYGGGVKLADDYRPHRSTRGRWKVFRDLCPEARTSHVGTCHHGPGMISTCKSDLRAADE